MLGEAERPCQGAKQGQGQEEPLRLNLVTPVVPPTHGFTSTASVTLSKKIPYVTSFPPPLHNFISKKYLVASLRVARLPVAV